MRDLPGNGYLRRPAWSAIVLAILVIAGCVSLRPQAAGARVLDGASSAPAPVRAHAATRRRRGHKLTPAQRRRRELQKKAKQLASLTLNSSFIRRLQAEGSVLPFTIRLRKPYEGGPGDDVLQLTWDDGSTPWPLAGTAAPTTPSTTNLDGAISYEWDFGADTSGYATLGTVETLIGGGISMTGTGFPIATQSGSTCSTIKSLAATGISFTTAGVRFGTLNPFSTDVSGTMDLRTTVRSAPTTCAGGATTPASAVATTASPDPPLPVAFNGTFKVSPSVTSDGYMRVGTLQITDTVASPQRSTYGLVYACTDPTAADGCARMAFPVRTKLISMNADVLVGDHMPGPPAAP